MLKQSMFCVNKCLLMQETEMQGVYISKCLFFEPYGCFCTMYKVRLPNIIITFACKIYYYDI